MDHGQPADLPALDQTRRFAPLLAGEIDVATGQRGDRRGAAGEHDAVRLRNRNAGGVQELGHGERRDPGDAGDAVAEGLGIGLGGRRHVLQALPRRVFLDGVHDGIEREQRDRRLALHLERHVAFDREQHRRARVWVEQQRVAVRPRADRAQCAGDARGARHVDDVHRLPPLLRRVGGDQPGGHVGSATGRVSHDDLHRARRVRRLRLDRSRQCRADDHYQAQQQRQGDSPHRGHLRRRDSSVHTVSAIPRPMKSIAIGRVAKIDALPCAMFSDCRSALSSIGVRISASTSGGVG